jgi:hypothetical protein
MGPGSAAHRIAPLRCAAPGTRDIRLFASNLFPRRAD